MQTGKWTQYTNILTYCYRSIYNSLLYYYIRIFLNSLEFIIYFPISLSLARPSSYILDWPPWHKFDISFHTNTGRHHKSALWTSTKVPLKTRDPYCLPPTLRKRRRTWPLLLQLNSNRTSTAAPVQFWNGTILIPDPNRLKFPYRLYFTNWFQS